MRNTLTPKQSSDKIDELYKRHIKLQREVGINPIKREKASDRPKPVQVPRKFNSRV